MKYEYSRAKATCPLCGFNDNLLLYSIKCEDIAKYIVPPTDSKKFKIILDTLNEISLNGIFKKNLCSNCELIFCEPFVAGTPEFYTAMYGKENYLKWKWDYEVAFNKIKKMSQKNMGRLLEIGAGNGSFVEKLKPWIGSKNIFCLEYSDNGLDEIRKKGIKNIGKDFLTMKIDKKFSFVCMFQVLEHMDRIDEVFTKISRISEKGTNIFITTPEPSTVMFFENSSTSLDLPPAHIGEYGEKTFEFICKKYGFKIEEIRKKDYKFFVRFLDMGLGMFNIRKMKNGKLECFINGIENKFLKKTLIVAYLAAATPLNFVRSIPKKMHTSQFVHLVKI